MKQIKKIDGIEYTLEPHIVDKDQLYPHWSKRKIYLKKGTYYLAYFPLLGFKYLLDSNQNVIYDHWPGVDYCWSKKDKQTGKIIALQINDTHFVIAENPKQNEYYAINPQTFNVNVVLNSEGMVKHIITEEFIIPSDEKK